MISSESDLTKTDVQVHFRTKQTYYINLLQNSHLENQVSKKGGGQNFGWLFNIRTYSIQLK